MSIPIEDNFEDVIGKSQRGLGLSDSQLASLAGLEPEVLRKIKGGNFDEGAVRAVAPPLGLNADALAQLGRKEYLPPEISVPGLAVCTTPFQDMTVNAYLAWDPASKQGVVFDSGADATPLLEKAASEEVRIALILLTHTHGDHVLDVDRLREKTGAPIFVSEFEPFEGAETFCAGKTFDVGALQMETRLTSGHSKGGITYVIRGLDRPVAIVGDSMFAGSMGGGMVSYQDALQNNREQILTLDDATVICPGHGPLTTVASEKAHNPFFA